MSILNNYTPGLNQAGSYQASGWPWVSGSAITAGQTIKMEFPYVAKAFTVISSGADGDLYIHFADTTAGNVISGKHYVTLQQDDDSLSLNVKCKEVYVTAPAGSTATGFELIAEMTNISTDKMFELTGSGVTE